MKAEMTIEQAEEIVMAAQLGMNYPEGLLPIAILLLKARESNPAPSEAK